jgi:hypothetical protein
MNEASQLPHGNVLAFLDDDVVVQTNWLCAVQQFFQEKGYQATQGVIRIRPPSTETPEFRTLINRYRRYPISISGPKSNISIRSMEQISPSHAKRSILSRLLTNDSDLEIREPPKT